MVIRRAPLIPNGCPSAIAPPCGFTLSESSGSPRSRSTASAWAANASLSSIRSKSSTESRHRSMALRLAGAGPIPIIRGSTPAVAIVNKRARGVSPNLLAAASDANRRAQAPSFTPAALPAVTVPPSRNGAGSFAKPSIVVSGRGCSSRSTMMGSLLRWGMLTGVISSAKATLCWATPARFWLRNAKASWSSRRI